MLKLIKGQVKDFKVPSVTEISYKKDPYRVLISCILSLRTKDKTTLEASSRLFKAASTPGDMVRLPGRRLERLIYPVGFYRNKTKVILEASRKIIKDHAGRVPDKLEGLLEFKGVGRKTANLVLGLGYNIPAICVDTHVHRVSNRLGWVKTKAPEDTEEALKKIIPRGRWIVLNTLLVAFGQNICVPVSPFCGRCFARKLCKRVGVVRSR
ncbi:MAG: endonuclease III [Candidatus Omnitrophota bacterium]